MLQKTIKKKAKIKEKRKETWQEREQKIEKVCIRHTSLQMCARMLCLFNMQKCAWRQCICYDSASDAVCISSGIFNLAGP